MWLYTVVILSTYSSVAGEDSSQSLSGCIVGTSKSQRLLYSESLCVIVDIVL